jgi:capsular polysaccharide biosynthesis protein
LTVALALSLLSYVRVSADGLSYRKPEIWSNEATLVLSDASHPELRSKLLPTADPNRFTSLVDQYAEFATSDAVIGALKRQGLLPRTPSDNQLASISATAVPSPINGATTPLLKITGMATSPAEATRLTIGATDTFMAVEKARQIRQGIPEGQRVELRIVNRATAPKLTAPRSKTTFIIILLAGFTVTVAAAFIRDNLQRRSDEQPSVVNRLQPAPQAAPPGDSKPLRAGAEAGSWPRVNAAEGEPEAGSSTHARRSAGSSG